jgi:SAM-dependent methyltransferase
MKLPRTARTIAGKLIRSIPVLRRQLLFSTDYRRLQDADEARAVAASSQGWLAARTVKRQERAYRSLIAEARGGAPRIDLRVAADAVTATGITSPTLLDVGCGSGYYSEILATLVPGGVRYTGTDYSQAMIDRARALYPSATFGVADATRLPYPDRAFDIVFNGVSLMHIIDYPAAIREAARVAAHFCIFHSVPIFDGDHPTTFLHKYAYGAPVVEAVFGRQELLAICSNAGLRLAREWPSIPYDVSAVAGQRSGTQTWLLKAGA